MEPNFWVIGLLLEYRSVIKFLAAVDILSGITAFMLELLRLSKVTAKALPLAYSGIWIGLAWIITGLFAALSSMHATQYQRLRSYLVGLILFCLLSVSICMALIVNISYFPPTLDNYPLSNFTRLADIDVVPFITDTGPGIRGMIWSKAAMVILAVVNLYTGCCELVFGLAQFRSGYFNFVEEWSQPISEYKLRRSRTVPVSRATRLEIDQEAPKELAPGRRPSPLLLASSARVTGTHAQARKVQSVPF